MAADVARKVDPRHASRLPLTDGDGNVAWIRLTKPMVAKEHCDEIARMTASQLAGAGARPWYLHRSAGTALFSGLVALAGAAGATAWIVDASSASGLAVSFLAAILLGTPILGLHAAASRAREAWSIKRCAITQEIERRQAGWDLTGRE